MKRKLISLALSVLLLFGNIPLTVAQMSQVPGQDVQQGLTNLNDVNRNAGSSFGSESKERKNLPQDRNNIPMGDRMLQMPTGMGIVYQVHILGEVKRPGTYRVTASTRLSEAVEQAGGILDRGSERRVELRRRDGGGKVVDLVGFKVFGNLEANPYLLDNDVIFVPLKKNTIDIEGAVKRPGVYELTREKRLEDVIRLGGGFTSGVSGPGQIKVVRFEDGKKQLIDVENSPSERKAFAVRNADVIVIPHILTENRKFDYNVGKLPGEEGIFYPSYEERVFVLGGVARPGPFPFSPYYDVRQYLTIAGGTTKMAKVKKIKIITADGRTVKATNQSSINPGDTIVVPERYMAPETFATLIVGITASIVGITAAIFTLTR